MPAKSRRTVNAARSEQSLLDLIERLLALPCTKCRYLGRCYDSAALECEELTTHLLRDP